jgi:hypothetical protein
MPSRVGRGFVPDFLSTLCGVEERSTGVEHSGAVLAEHGVAGVHVREQLGCDLALADREGEEPVQPGREHRSGRLALNGLGGLADGADLVGIEGLEKLTAAGEVAVQRRHADPGSSRDLGHRDLDVGFGECGTGGREDLVAIAFGVGASRG